MKRILFSLALLFLLYPGMSQSYVTVSGYVTDNLTGYPVQNHAVHITSDSTFGWVYTNTVFTNDNGYYHDSVYLAPAIDSGFLYIYTYDCNNALHSYTHFFGPNNLVLVQNFQICSAASCQANFTYAQNAPLTVQFTDQSTNTTGPWYWNFGDNTYSSTQHPSHTYSSPGYYTVILFIGALGTTCYDSAFQTIYVADTTGGSCVAAFVAYPDSTSGNTVHFYDQSTGNIAFWTWNFGDGTPAVTGIQHPVHTYQQAGLYTVCLTVQGVDSSCYDTYCEVVNVNASGGCQAQFTYYTDTIGSLEAIQFVDLSTGNITSWAWDFGDPASGMNNTSTLQHPVHAFSAPGTYYVCLTIQSMNNGTICESTWCQNIEVGNSTNCDSYFTFQKNGLTVSFAGHMVNQQPATYQWSFGDGQSGTGQTAVHQYPSAGIYYVTLTTVTQDSSGCTFSSAQSITVGDTTQWNQVYGQVFAGNFPLESGMVMIFSLDTSNNFVPFIDISLVDSLGIYYFSMVPLGNYVIYALPFLPAGYLPTYYGDVLNWEDATVVTLGQAANPYDIHLIEATAYTSGNGGINGQITTGLKSPVLDKITMLLMNEAGEGISYHQVDGAGAFDFTSLGYGVYYLKAELAGCQSDNIRVELTPDNPVVDVVMTFTGNHILGVKENTLTLEAGVVYPNPVRDVAQIDLNLNEGTTAFIELFNLSGQRVFQYTESLHAGQVTITVPVSQLRDGLYTLRIYTNSGVTLSRKLLKTQ